VRKRCDTSTEGEEGEGKCAYRGLLFLLSASALGAAKYKHTPNLPPPTVHTLGLPSVST